MKILWIGKRPKNIYTEDIGKMIDKFNSTSLMGSILDKWKYRNSLLKKYLDDLPEGDYWIEDILYPSFLNYHFDRTYKNFQLQYNKNDESIMWEC